MSADDQPQMCAEVTHIVRDLSTDFKKRCSGDFGNKGHDVLLRLVKMDFEVGDKSLSAGPCSASA